MNPERETGPAGDDSLDHYARLVRRLLCVPTSLVTIVEAHRQIFPGASGLQEPYRSTRQTPISHSYCQYVVADEQPLIVPDARQEPRLAGNPAIAELDAIAYAGWPLIDGGGRTVGSLCAIDIEPHAWSADDLEVLHDLALACSAELQQSHRVVQDAESLAHAIFASVNVAMAFYDPHGRLVLANDLAEQAAEASGSQLDQPPYAGPYVYRADNQTPVPTHDQIIPRALRGELYDHEMEWFGPPGNQMAIIASATRVRRADGTFWGTLIAGHDVTDLARALLVKEEFVNTVSHELRTPLTSILGFVELLVDELEVSSGTPLRALDAIHRNALRLQHTIADLLDTADRNRRLTLQASDVSALARRAAANIRAHAECAGLALSITTEETHWAVVDPSRIEQAIGHLLSNAVTYTQRGGHITITVSGDPDRVAVAVADDGTGMSPDESSQAFNSFWRADSARQNAVQGVGIGLTIVRDTVRAHHGSIDMSTHPGIGTTVRLTIPRHPGSVPAPCAGQFRPAPDAEPQNTPPSVR